MRLAAARGGRPQFSQLLTLGLFLGGAVLVALMFLFTHLIIGRLSREVAATSRVFARFCAQASLPATRDPQLQLIFSEVIANIDFPVVITDTDTIPRAWRQIDVDPASVPAASIDSVALGLSIAPPIQERLERVRAKVRELDRKNQPIPMIPVGSMVGIGAVHYGEPPVLELLGWMPIVSVGGVALLFGIGLWGLTIIRQAEKRTIWVGMAKETAHQLGTPISSLMGWTELLRARAEDDAGAGVVTVPTAELMETIGEMERDLERLRKVTERFSHIGSAPKLESRDVAPIARDVVAYMRRRMSQNPDEVAVRERYEDVPPVRLNPELVEWALENLISNALSALDQRPGLIEVTVGPARGGRTVEIVVKDNGRGMSPAEQRKAFEPGYTTKRRGWGLGLALTRRVVEEYHGGRISIRASAPGQGTTMVIGLPV